MYSSLSSLCNSNSSPSSFWWSQSSTPARMMFAFFACWSLGKRSSKWLEGSHVLTLMTALLCSLMKKCCLESWGSTNFPSRLLQAMVSVPFLIPILGSQTHIFYVLEIQYHILVIGFRCMPCPKVWLSRVTSLSCLWFSFVSKKPFHCSDRPAVSGCCSKWKNKLIPWTYAHHCSFSEEKWLNVMSCGFPCHWLSPSP